MVTKPQIRMRVKCICLPHCNMTGIIVDIDNDEGVSVIWDDGTGNVRFSPRILQPLDEEEQQRQKHADKYL